MIPDLAIVHNFLLILYYSSSVYIIINIAMMILPGGLIMRKSPFIIYYKLIFMCHTPLNFQF